jgi:hypothetical protein
MAGRKQLITLGIALAVALLAAFTPGWIAVLLFLLAAFLIAWGIQPTRTEEFVGRRLPYGNYVLKALSKLDGIISRWS